MRGKGGKPDPGREAASGKHKRHADQDYGKAVENHESLMGAFAAHLVWQVKSLRIGDPALCLRLFKSNRDAGLLLFAGLLADAVIRA